MDTQAFLQAVWPASGVYCLATPFTPEGSTLTTYAHKTVESIDDAVKYVKWKAADNNVFFAVHTLKEHRVWNEAKKIWNADTPRTAPDGRVVTGPFGGYERRTQANAKEARCFFFDLDVGESTQTTPKYATRQEALNGLEKFLFSTRLPTPLVTSSGGGFHVYWLLSEALPSEQWAVHARVLHHLARRYGLRADPARTDDAASVLRVVGTDNLKKDERRPCVALQDGVVTDTTEFLAQLADALGGEVVPPKVGAPRRAPGAISGNLRKVWDGPTRTLEEVTAVCEHVRNYVDTGYTEGGYVAFYHIGCGILPFLENGHEIAMEQALRHPRCTEEYAESIIETYAARTDNSPSTCANLAAKCGGDACARCPFANLGRSPLSVATANVRQAAAGIPRVDADAASPLELIVEPPFPWTRVKGGIMEARSKTDKDGNRVDLPPELICQYDFFPYDVCERTELEQSFSMWAAIMPRGRQKIIKVASEALQDTTTLHKLLIDHGVIIPDVNIPKVKKMMQHWIGTIQKHKDANPQYDHLGWTDKNTTEFILPTVSFRTDGTEQPCALSSIARSAALHVKQAGTLDRQIELLEFYNKPEYLKHQFIIMCGLGSVMLHATDLAGVVVNATGESGGSKSSAIYTAASFWGDPEPYTINANRQGATALSHIETIFTLCSLPACIDEITHFDEQQGKDFVFNSTQRKQRIRLDNTGKLKPTRGGYKSCYYLTTSNKSIHELLAENNRGGTAGDFRVIEINFPELKKNPAEYIKFFHDLCRNYGHVGPEFLRHYVPQRAAWDAELVAERNRLDAKFGFISPERYWSAGAVSGLCAGEKAYELGLLPYKVPLVREWMYDVQLPEMRGVIASAKDTYHPAGLLASFLDDSLAQTISVHPPAADGSAFATDPPRNGITIHHDIATHVKHVRKEAFRHWCERQKRSGLHTIRELERLGLIFDVNRKHVIGKGTTYASGQTICFSVDLTNPAFVGTSIASKVVPLTRTGTKLREVKA